MSILALLMTLSAPPTLAVAHVHAAAVTPAAEAEPDRTVALRIESKALLEQQVADAAEDTTYFVRTDSAKALSEQHGVRVVDGDTAPAIVVHLSWVSYADSIYGVRVETVRPGEAPKLVESFECECADSELTAAVISRLPAALEQLEAREPAVTEPVVELDGKDPVTEQPTSETDDHPRRPLGKLGKAGIGVGVVGAGALLTGGVFYALGGWWGPPTGNLEYYYGRDYKPPAIALMVTGGAALAAGVVLLVVDRTRARKRASALLLPSSGGLVLTGRF